MRLCKFSAFFPLKSTPRLGYRSLVPCTTLWGCPTWDPAHPAQSTYSKLGANRRDSSRARPIGRRESSQESVDITLNEIETVARNDVKKIHLQQFGNLLTEVIKVISIATQVGLQQKSGRGFYSIIGRSRDFGVCKKVSTVVLVLGKN